MTAHIAAAVALALVGGCGERPSSVASPGSPPSSSAAGPPATAAGASPDEDERPAETYALDKPSLDAPDVEVSWSHSTGTTHFADRVRIRDRAGAELLIETPEDAFQHGRPLAPLLEVARRVQGARTLLLGWSSTGGGTQTYHALVVTNVAPQIVGELTWTDTRGGPGIAASGTSIGVPEPSGSETELVVRGVHEGREALARLSYAPPPADATFYAAPFRHDDARSRATRFTWFDIGEGSP